MHARVSPEQHEAVENQLAGTLAMLEGMRQDMDRNPVKQHSFGGGEIDLF